MAQRVMVFDQGDVPREVLRLLQREHVGAANAITQKALSALFNVNERRMHQILADLVMRQKQLVGSQCRKPFGHFIIDGPDDLEIATRHLWTRAMYELARVGILRRQSPEQLHGQIQEKLHY